MKNFNRSFLYLALLLGMSNVYAGNDVNIADNPLEGFQDTDDSNTTAATTQQPSYSPNLYLALSVEFPTAGAAYSTKLKMDSIADLTERYIGYFDNTKCYRFDETEKAFIPSSRAKLINRTYYGCNNREDNPYNGQEFSGNVMNYMTMSAIDMLRYVMTGGNRAKGIESKSSNYTIAENGYQGSSNNPNHDPAKGEGVYLRHSNVTWMIYRNFSGSNFNYNQSSGQINKDIMGTDKGRHIDFSSSEMKEAIKYLVPHKYIPDVINNNPNHKFKNPWIVYNEITDQTSDLPQAGTNDPADGLTKETDALYFQFRDFSVLIGRKLKLRGRYATPDKGIESPKKGDVVYIENGFVKGNVRNEGYLPLVVLACSNIGTSAGSDDVLTGRDDTKCKDNKPVGIMQNYLGKLNYAALGYHIIDAQEGNDREKMSGGVLRAKLNDLSAEIESDGSFKINPDATSASKTATKLNIDNVANSGVINYLNKFGDISGYKGSDNQDTLYYDTTRYIRGLTEIPNRDAAANGYLKQYGNKVADGFPLIEYDGSYDDDPLVASSGMSENTYNTMRTAVLSGDETAAIAAYNNLDASEQEKYRNAACRVNYVVLIGDTFSQQNRRGTPRVPTGCNGTHADVCGSGLENLENDKNGVNKFNAGMTVETYARAALKDRYDSKRWGGWPQGQHSDPLGVGVAYWMRANDNRKDLLGQQRASNFIIDVLENYNQFGGRPYDNEYYEMAKWGGISLDLVNGLQPNANNPNNNGLALEPNGETIFDKNTSYTNGAWVADMTGRFFVDKTQYQDCQATADETNSDCLTESGSAGKYVWVDGGERAYNDAIQKSFKALTNAREYFNSPGNKSFYKETPNPLLPIPYNLAAGNNPESLEQSLNAMIASAITPPGQDEVIINSIESFSAGAVTSSSLGFTVCANPSDTGEDKCTADRGETVQNKVISGVYDLNSKSGDVILQDVYIYQGETTTKKVSSGSLAQSIKNRLASGSGRNLKTYQSKTIETDFTETYAPTMNLDTKVVNYIRGDSRNSDAFTTLKDGTKYPQYVGTIINSNILEIPVPSAQLSQNRGNTYNAIQCSSNNSRTQRLLGVASNDGIYHIMSSTNNNLDEIYGYIPSTAWEKLEVNPTEHKYINDGLSLHFEFCAPNDSNPSSSEYKSLVIGTTGRGGQAVYAIDVTGNTPKLAWEINNSPGSSYPGLGYTIPSVTSSFLANGTPVVIISSGYNSSATHGHIYVVDARNGDLVASLQLGSSGVGTPFAYDHNKDGILDAIYVGDFAGNVWKVAYDFTDNQGTIEQRWSSSEKLFDADKDLMVSGDKANPTARPVTLAPYVVRKGEDVYVIFATGHTLNRETGGLEPEVQNYAYGIVEPEFSTSVAKAGDSPLPANNNLKLVDAFHMPNLGEGTKSVGNSTDTQYYNDETVYDNIDLNAHKGWRMTLAKGYTVTAVEAVKSRVAAFIATKPYTMEECKQKREDPAEQLGAIQNEEGKQTISSADELCSVKETVQQEGCVSGTTAVIAVDIASGTQYKGKSVFDTSGDNEIHSASECEGYSGEELTTCMAKVDEQASVIFIDDLLSSGGSFLKAIVPLDGTTKQQPLAFVGGTGTKGAKAGGILMNNYGINSFIRNSLREIRR